ncbi:MFS transporter [Parablautia intestinalis]|uniref:MFS transporter n=1 Tax=Parablautia intestinalis TaxID=2320100 RepID=A0A3A9AJ57_9FIRM|nr:MFS transporter [Parablautia intestinalis]RKI91389.1 MFS transporter [Parablautia intestinalis]
MLNIKKQITRLYVSSALWNLSLTGAWVAILAARGYSLLEIGFAETVFHITSLLFEIPSGILADLFGRKNMLIVSTVMKIIGNIIMITSCNLFMVCAALSFYAMSYNFSSGSGDALAYDSLKMVGKEAYYERYASNELIIHRFCGGVSTLCAGFALFIGHKAAYGADVLMCAVQIGTLLPLREVYAGDGNNVSEGSKANGKNIAGNLIGSIGKEFVKCFAESLSFIKKERKTMLLMLSNSLVGAVDILLLFFLQAKLPKAGVPDGALGFALFFMEMGGVLGARMILKCKKLRYKNVFAATALFVLLGVLLEHSGVYMVMMLGGFLAAFSDDALQVRTNTILQDMFPSKQRATLISIESFTFSMIMIVLSPLAGVVFSWW